MEVRLGQVLKEKHVLLCFYYAFLFFIMVGVNSNCLCLIDLAFIISCKPAFTSVLVQALSDIATAVIIVFTLSDN